VVKHGNRKGHRMDITRLATPTNIFSLGALIAVNSDNGFALFTGTDLAPGEVRRAEIMIANIGLVNGRVRLFERHVSSNVAPGELTLTIDEFNGSDVRIFEGEIGGLPVGGLPLGEYVSGEERSYRFTATLAKNAEARERRGAVAAYEWNADRGT
jgi:hypothetical protein